MTDKLTITIEQIRAAKVCSGTIDRFEAIFGESVEVTEEAASKVASEFFWDLAASHLLTPAACAAYEKSVAPVLIAYRDATSPARVAYRDVVTVEMVAEAARKEADAVVYGRDKTPVLDAFVVAIAPALKTYAMAIAPAKAAYEEASATAFARAYIDDWYEHQDAFDACLLSIPPDETPDLAKMKTKWATQT